FQQFHGMDAPTVEGTTIMKSIWLYVVIAVIVIAIIAFVLLRRRKESEETEEVAVTERTPVDTIEQPEVTDMYKHRQIEEKYQRGELEKMGKDKPEDFARLLRSWSSED